MFVKAGADLLKAIRSGYDGTGNWKDILVNQSRTRFKAMELSKPYMPNELKL